MDPHSAYTKINCRWTAREWGRRAVLSSPAKRFGKMLSDRTNENEEQWWMNSMHVWQFFTSQHKTIFVISSTYGWYYKRVVRTSSVASSKQPPEKVLDRLFRRRWCKVPRLGGVCSSGVPKQSQTVFFFCNFFFSKSFLPTLLIFWKSWIKH
jgi:hypothetical protein